MNEDSGNELQVLPQYLHLALTVANIQCLQMLSNTFSVGDGKVALMYYKCSYELWYHNG
jgi:hypothetical protein